MASISELRKQTGRERIEPVIEEEEVIVESGVASEDKDVGITPEEVVELVHYDGTLGVFDYNPKLWKIKSFDKGRGVLKYIGPVNVPIDLPKGVNSTAFMFDSIIFEEGAYLRDFDTSLVENMSYMFCRAELCKGFTLGDKFYTGHVKYMAGMFESTVLNEDFSLGEHFDTSNVLSFNHWMNKCSMNKGFTLGKHFHTGAATQANGMFMDCRFDSEFKFPSNFEVGHIAAEEKKSMFLRQRGLQGLMGIETPEEVVAEFKLVASN